jgi:hypothetical protein
VAPGVAPGVATGAGAPAMPRPAMHHAAQ